jgi:cytidylate kinase
VNELNSIHIKFQYNASEQKSETFLNGVNVEKDIRTMEISKQVSAISAISEVRSKLVGIQQTMGAEGGVVMDGRDIGTVVFPNAEVKLFMTASNDIRAERRYKEMKAKGQDLTLEEVKKSIARRDHYDMNREISPLMKAEDDIELDNSELGSNRTVQFGTPNNQRENRSFRDLSLIDLLYRFKLKVLLILAS